MDEFPRECLADRMEARIKVIAALGVASQ